MCPQKESSSCADIQEGHGMSRSETQDIRPEGGGARGDRRVSRESGVVMHQAQIQIISQFDSIIRFAGGPSSLSVIYNHDDALLYVYENPWHTGGSAV